jgi:hypothetical protein
MELAVDVLGLLDQIPRLIEVPLRFSVTSSFFSHACHLRGERGVAPASGGGRRRQDRDGHEFATLMRGDGRRFNAGWRRSSLAILRLRAGAQ